MKRFPSPGALTGGLLTLALLPAFWPSGAPAQEVEACNDPATDLVLRPKLNVDTDVGDIFVCNDETTLVVTIKTTYPWCLLKTDLHAATIPGEPAEPDDNIPQDKNGEPNPGEFGYGDQHDCEGTATFPIDLADIDGGVGAGDTIVAAVHAEVDDGARKEGAWGDGTRFVEWGTWAMYFTYTVEEPFLCGGEESKCVFVTSTSHNGNLGGLDGADQICQDLADSADSLAAPGTYKAWLSVIGGDSPSTRFTRATVPYVRVDGVKVAEHWDDLTTPETGEPPGCLDAPIRVTEDGSDPGFRGVRTATGPAGDPDDFNRMASDFHGWSEASAFSVSVRGISTSTV